MYSGYFALGGAEIGNNPRAVGYTRTADCPITWFKDDQCTTLQTALGSQVYTFENISQAPWYDPDFPERSSRIYGLYVVSMDGLNDSSREVPVTQKVTDGARLGRTRRAAREVRIRAVLAASGQDALDAGMVWLENTLNAESCGIHNSACGLSDFEFFTSCPPGRDMIPGYTEWAIQRQNLFKNPQATNTLAANYGTTLGTLSNRTDFPIYSLSKTTAVRWTRTGAGSGGPGIKVGTSLNTVQTVVGSPTPTPGIIGQVILKSSVAMSVRAYYRPDISSATGQIAANGTAIPVVSAGPGYYNFEIPWTPGSATAESGVVFLTSDGAVASFLDIAGLAVLDRYDPPYNVGYVDGDWPNNPPTQRVRWLGTPNDSVSVSELRYAIMVPEGDDTYVPKVDAYRRYLHSVKTISGPLVQQEIKGANGEANGYIVEFTLASETAHVFTKTRKINLLPTQSTVVQDIPYNLAAWPSAEVSLGTVVVATNLSVNPSLETNVTGWSGGSNLISGTATAAFRTQGRVTGELAAAGTASYRIRILGDGVTTAGGRSGIFAVQSVSLSGVAAGTRLSLGMWGSAVSVGGATGAALVSMGVVAEWFNGATSLGTVSLGLTTAPSDFAGKAFSLKAQAIPAGATSVQLTGTVVVDWSSSATPASNSDIRAYFDALAVTIP